MVAFHTALARVTDGMEFGCFNILCVTVPLIVALCVMYYFYTDIVDRIDRLGKRRDNAAPAAGEPRATPTEAVAGGVPDGEDDSDGAAAAAAAAAAEAEIIEDILRESAPIFAMTLQTPPAETYAGPGAATLRRRGRRPKASTAVVIEDAPTPEDASQNTASRDAPAPESVAIKAGA